MNLEQQKERALTFLRGLEKPDATSYQDLLADDFEFEMMGRLPGVAPIRGKEAFLKSTPPMLKAMFPNGLNIKLHFGNRRGAACRGSGRIRHDRRQREEIREPVSLLRAVQGRQDRAGARVQRHQPRARSLHELSWSAGRSSK